MSYLTKQVLTNSDGRTFETEPQEVAEDAGYVTYDSTTAALTLGKSGDPSKVVVDNDSMDIVVGNETAASFTGDSISLCADSGNISSWYADGSAFGGGDTKSLTMIAGDNSQAPNNASLVSLGSSSVVDTEMSECRIEATSKYQTNSPASASVVVRAGTAITPSGIKTNTSVRVNADSVSFNGGALPISSGGTGSMTADGAVANLKSPLVNLIYPVGAIYLSTVATSPATLFGGSWTQIKDTFLLAAGTYAAGSSGGEATHKLTVAEMPSHTHTISESNGVSGGTWRLATHKSSGTNTSMKTNATGSTTAHNNMPPYLAVYVWKRTA